MTDNQCLMTNCKNVILLGAELVKDEPTPSEPKSEAELIQEYNLKPAGDIPGGTPVIHSNNTEDLQKFLEAMKNISVVAALDAENLEEDFSAFGYTRQKRNINALLNSINLYVIFIGTIKQKQLQVVMLGLLLLGIN